MLHIKQPTLDTCTSACLAMITGFPVELIVEEYHAAHRNRDINAAQFLDKYNIPYRHGTPWTIIDGPGLYLITVPSLNQMRLFHNILYAVWQEQDGLWYHQTFDPMMGVPDRLYYIAHGAIALDDLAHPIGGYIVDLVITDTKRYNLSV